jgi:hypothetical protein
MKLDTHGTKKGGEMAPKSDWAVAWAGGARKRNKGPGRQSPQVPADRNNGDPVPPLRFGDLLRLSCGRRTRPEPNYPFASLVI